MAGNLLGTIAGFVDKRLATKGGSTVSVLSSDASYASVTAMRTRLAAINGTYYTTKKLDQMSSNDMVWAIRNADDAAGIR